MQDLHLVGFTKDHRHLIFSTRKDAKSGDFVVPVDDDLLHAVDEVVSHRDDDRASAEPVAETPPEQPRVEAQLSVREVQARLRAGDRVESIAADAGVDAAWVERFAPPVRAEQRRVVDRALTVPLARPRAGDSAVPLRRAIAVAMAERDVDLSAEEFESAWSARLVGDSKWMIGFEFPNRGRSRRLEWKFDVGTGELTTKDRFASQLAFVASDEDLPPADVTVGSVPVHSGGGLVRGSVTSGGLARPGSGRVTPPSRSATPLPETVRRPPPTSATDAPTSPRAPLPNVDPEPRPPTEQSAPPERPASERPAPSSSPEPTPVTRQPQPDDPGPESEPTTPVAAPADEPVGARDERVAPPGSPAPRPGGHILEQPPLPPKPVDRRSSAPVSERSAPPSVPPRRPAPVALPTNASMAYTRRPVREIAPRLPVVVDADAGEPESTRRRPALIEDRRALDDAVPSQPPAGNSESVIILRAVDEPEDVPERETDEDPGFPEATHRDAGSDYDTPPLDDEWDEDVDDEWEEDDDDDWEDEAEGDWDDELDDDWEDEVEDERDDHEVARAEVEPTEDEPEHTAVVSDVDVEDEDWVYDDDADEGDPVDRHVLDEEDVHDDDFEDVDDEDEVDEDWVDDEDADEEWVDEEDWDEDDDGDEPEILTEDEVESDAEDESPPVRPVRATLRPSRQAPRRVVARRQLTAADAVAPDDDDELALDESEEADDDRRTDDRTAASAPRRSSVQFRPGAATQAGAGRADPSGNGRVPADDEADDGDDAAAETRPTPRPRRRRREPLRAR